jgi:hypothetical protein
MWIFLWFILSAFLVGATLWSLQILLRQKTAWEKYAKKKGFIFNKGTFMGPAEMSGTIDKYKLSFFTAERPGADVRTRRYVTAIEIDLAEGVVDSGAFGTREMIPFMMTLDMLHPYTVEIPGLETEYKAFVKRDAVMNAYLNKDRVEAIGNILKTRNADTLLLFNDNEVVLRLETSDPMQDADKIDKIVTRMLGLVDKLRVSDEERARCMAAAA